MSGRPLLCELHAHSTWSDGDLSIPELVDLYGTSGFDVLCITDHVGRSGPEWRDPRWRIAGPVRLPTISARSSRRPGVPTSSTA